MAPSKGFEIPVPSDVSRREIEHFTSADVSCGESPSVQRCRVLLCRLRGVGFEVDSNGNHVRLITHNRSGFRQKFSMGVQRVAY